MRTSDRSQRQKAKERIGDLLTVARMSEIIGKSASYVYKCLDPDSERSFSSDQLLDLNDECIEAHGESPLAALTQIKTDAPVALCLGTEFAKGSQLRGNRAALIATAIGKDISDLSARELEAVDDALSAEIAHLTKQKIAVVAARELGAKVPLRRVA